MQTFLQILLVLASIAFSIGTGGQVGIPITARDARGHSQTIRIGLRPGATYGFDEELGEIPLPPYPPIPVLDIRLEDPEGRKQYRFDGSWVDIRPFTSSSQCDTFYIRYQAAPEAFPLVFSWDNRSFDHFDGALLVGNLTTGAVQCNMRTEHQIIIPDGEFTVLRLILSGPHDSDSSGGK
ncbi:MAG TPA: hypothetical protein VMG09_16500 [Bacteroidota bacterium]|nr:hypothetical protein [Bacteroidota bacterium]